MGVLEGQDMVGQEWEAKLNSFGHRVFWANTHGRSLHSKILLICATEEPHSIGMWDKG